jgi:hypothetical protein
MAQSWDAGIYPYRDIRAFNFPGHIYLHLFVGKTIGWGHPAAFYAVDAALLLALGAALVAWGRQRFGAILPGLLAYLAFVTQYLSLDYTQVAQRDWHAILLVVLALMTLQIAGSRRSRVTSGLLAAFAFVFRPHVLLFLGAFWSAIDEHLQERPRRETRRARAFVEWSAGFALGLLFGFAPLVLAGVLPDFIGGLSVGMYGGPHVVTTPAEAFFGFLRQLGMKWTLIGVSAGPLLAIYGSPEWRRRAPRGLGAHRTSAESRQPSCGDRGRRCRVSVSHSAILQHRRKHASDCVDRVRRTVRSPAVRLS